MRTAIVALALVTLGCGPPCTPMKHAIFAVPTLGIYLACLDRAQRQAVSDGWAREVDRCVAQGGDPAACRCAVYGCARSSVTVYR